MGFLTRLRNELMLSEADRETAVNLLKGILEAAEPIVGAVPAVGEGAKAAISAIIAIIEQAESANNNIETFNRLKDGLRSLLIGLLRPLLNSGLDSVEYPNELLIAIYGLMRRLLPICNRLEKSLKRGFLVRFINAKSDNAAIEDFKDEIDRAVQQLMVAQNIIKIAQDRVAELRRRVESIPLAQAATWDSTRVNPHVSCFEGTRTEVLHEINEWINNKESTIPRIFWLSGLAGIGKSTIARSIAEKAAKDGILGGSFFFSRYEDELHDISRLFSTLALQLSKHHASYLPFIGTSIENDIHILKKPAETQFRRLILDPILKSSYKPPLLLLVLDALDEASPEDRVKETLQMLLQIDIPFALRILITSRPEAHIRIGFGDSKPETHSKLILHDIENSVVEGDIRTFLDHGLRSIPRRLGLELPWP